MFLCPKTYENKSSLNRYKNEKHNFDNLNPCKFSFKKRIR